MYDMITANANSYLACYMIKVDENLIYLATSVLARFDVEGDDSILRFSTVSDLFSLS